MVSTSGFSSSAKAKAKHNGIVLRTLTNFKAEETIEWLDGCNLREPKFNIIDTKLELLNVLKPHKDKGSKLKRNFVAEERNILIESTRKYVSFPEIVNSVNKLNDNSLFKDLNDNDSPVIKDLNWDFYPNVKLIIEIENEQFYIKTWKFKLKNWIEARSLDFKNALKYAEEGNPLLDGVNYEVQISNKILTFTIIKDYSTGLIGVHEDALKEVSKNPTNSE